MRLVLGLSLAVVALLGFAAPGRAAEPAPGTGSGSQEPTLVIDSGGHTTFIRKVLFTHDGRYLVSAGDDKTVRVWSVATGEPVRTLRGQIQPGSEGKIFAAALSPDDRYLAVGGFLTPQGGVRLLDVQTGEVVGVFQGHENVVHALAFSPDGRRLASGGADRTIRLWDVASRQPLHVLSGQTGSVSTVAFSPDGTRLVSGSFDSSLRLWDATTGQLLREMQRSADRPRSPAFSAAFSPDGRFIASAGDDRIVRLWDAGTGAFVQDLRDPGRGADPIFGLAFAPDGRLLVGNIPLYTGGSVLSVPQGETLAQFDRHDNNVTALAISPDGRTAATAGGHAQEIYLWDLKTGALIRKLVGRGRPVWSVGFAPDGRSIAFGTTSRPRGLDDRGPLEQVLLLDRGANLGVALGGKVAGEETFLRAVDRSGAWQLRTRSGGNDRVLQILREGQVVQEIVRDSTSGYDHRCFTWIPGGTEIASGGANGVLTLYDRDTGRKVRDLVGHTSEVWAVAASADGKWLVSGSYDQTLRLWDRATGANLLTVFVATDGEWVAWIPQGYYTSSLHGDRYVGWHVNQGAAHAAVYYAAAQFARQLYRPDVVAEYLKDGDLAKALARADARRGPGVAPSSVVASVAAIQPPRLNVDAPLPDGLVVEKDALRIRATARSDNLPITDFRVTVNGIQVAGLPPGTAKGVPLLREVETEVTLHPGDNEILFQAAHAKATSQPLARHVTYRPPAGAPPAAPARPNLILLAIGISSYRDPLLKLSWAAKDAQEVFQSFQRQAGRLFGKVEARLLSVGEGRADQAEILAALHWFEGEGKTGDLRLLFLSGHGALDGHRNFYFVSQDQAAGDDPGLAGIAWSRFLDSLTKGSSVRSILMVDTCHAAAATGGPALARADLTEVVKSARKSYWDVVAFTASTAAELSYERDDWAGGHGAFTAALLEGLAGKADGFVGGTKDGRVDTLELSAWLARRVAELTGERQHADYDSGGVPPFPLFQVEP